jgi:DNA-binding NtrC family response regulator
VAPERTRAGIETASLGPARGPRQGHLLLVQSASSARIPLPESGEWILGRGGDCDLRIEDPGVSRRHASLTIAAGTVTLADLGSRHGTTLNGAKLGGPRSVFSGDVIGLGEAVLVAHLPSPELRPREVDSHETLLRRIEQEIDRARAYDLRFSLLALGPFPSSAARLEAALGLARALPPRVLVAADGDGFAWALLPEVGPEEALDLACVSGAFERQRFGVAWYPGDGCSTGALLRVARLGAADTAPIPGGILVASPAMVRLYALLRRLARSELPVLIRGETGVGKEHAARAVHEGSPRSSGPFLALNCAALTESLADSTLFGHERGAFTGASERRPGLFEAASGGTLFLDEIGELPPAIQAKLLRAIETRRVTRVGSTREIDVNVRLVAATHRDLTAQAAAGQFRQDLLFRIGACVVEIPPLRERPEEILLLARRFLAEARSHLGLPPLALSAEAAHRLAEHGWPGNVRELRNTIAYAAAIADGDALHPWDLPAPLAGPALEPGPSQPPEASKDPEEGVKKETGSKENQSPERPVFLPLAEELKALERRRMEEALQAADGVQRRAAALLQMPLRTFCMKLRQHNLSWPERWHRRGLD